MGQSCTLGANTYVGHDVIRAHLQPLAVGATPVSSLLCDKGPRLAVSSVSVYRSAGGAAVELFHRDVLRRQWDVSALITAVSWDRASGGGDGAETGTPCSQKELILRQTRPTTSGWRGGGGNMASRRLLKVTDGGCWIWYYRGTPRPGDPYHWNIPHKCKEMWMNTE